MPTWLVTYIERTYFTKIEGEEVESVLVGESIKQDVEGTFNPTPEGIKAFKEWHEGQDGDCLITVDLLSWSEIKEKENG